MERNGALQPGKAPQAYEMDWAHDALLPMFCAENVERAGARGEGGGAEGGEGAQQDDAWADGGWVRDLAGGHAGVLTPPSPHTPCDQRPP